MLVVGVYLFEDEDARSMFLDYFRYLVKYLGYPLLDRRPRRCPDDTGLDEFLA